MLLLFDLKYSVSLEATKEIKRMFLLHAHAEESHGFLTEVLWHGLADTLRLIPFLFFTYLIMEFIEHKASDKAENFMRRAGKFGPVVGGALGALPQCGFSAAASGFFSGGVITYGTLIAVFLSTSDEMIPVLIGGNIPWPTVLLMVIYKTLCGIAVGLLIDLIIRLSGKGRTSIDIDEMCEEDNCHCEKGIFYSAFRHTLTISLFVLIVTIGIGSVIYFVGEENIGGALAGIPVVSHLLSAVIGLIPNCAVSVALATLAGEGIISLGVMLSGLFSGAGVGLLVLIRTHRRRKTVLLTGAILVFTGTLLGLLADVIF